MVDVEMFRGVFSECFRNAMILYLVALTAIILELYKMVVRLIEHCIALPKIPHGISFFNNCFLTGFLLFFNAVFLLTTVYLLGSIYKKSRRYIVTYKEDITDNLFSGSIIVLLAMLNAFVLYTIESPEVSLGVILLMIALMVILGLLVYVIVTWPLRKLKRIYICSASIHEIFDLIGTALKLQTAVGVHVLSSLYLSFLEVDKTLQKLAKCDKKIARIYYAINRLTKWGEFVSLGYYKVLKKATRRHSLLVILMAPSILSIPLIATLINNILLLLPITLILATIPLYIQYIIFSLDENKTKELLIEIGVNINEEFYNALFYYLTVLLWELYNFTENKIGGKIMINNTTKYGIASQLYLIKLRLV